MTLVFPLSSESPLLLVLRPSPVSESRSEGVVSVGIGKGMSVPEDELSPAKRSPPGAPTSEVISKSTGGPSVGNAASFLSEVGIGSSEDDPVEEGALDELSSMSEPRSNPSDVSEGLLAEVVDVEDVLALDDEVAVEGEVEVEYEVAGNTSGDPSSGMGRRPESPAPTLALALLSSLVSILMMVISLEFSTFFRVSSTSLSTSELAASSSSLPNPSPPTSIDAPDEPSDMLNPPVSEEDRLASAEGDGPERGIVDVVSVVLELRSSRSSSPESLSSALDVPVLSGGIPLLDELEVDDDGLSLDVGSGGGSC